VDTDGRRHPGRTQAGDIAGFIALSADGQRVALDATYNDNAGQVRLFEWDGSSWNQLGPEITGDMPGTENSANTRRYGITATIDVPIFGLYNR
jgi:hypothetical protein